MSESSLSVSSQGVEKADLASEDSGHSFGPKRLVFDEYGDLELLLIFLDSTEAVALVCSSAMSIASPPWRKFIHPPFSTSSKDERDVSKTAGTKKQLSFREDNAEALVILLHIVHLQFDSVPLELSFQCLVNLAILCDEYDCSRLLEPWKSQWLHQWKPFLTEGGYEDWLSIAYVFGQVESFEKLSRKLVVDIRIGDNGRAALPNGKPFEFGLPPHACEHILEVRTKVIKLLLDIPWNEIRKYESKPNESVCKSLREKDRKACDGIVYGTLLREVRSGDVWRQDSSNPQCPVSIYDLASKLKAITILNTSLPGSHSRCRQSYEIIVNEIVRNMPDPVLESHRRHMEAVHGPGSHNQSGQCDLARDRAMFEGDQDSDLI